MGRQADPNIYDAQGNIIGKKSFEQLMSEQRELDAGLPARLVPEDFPFAVAGEGRPEDLPTFGPEGTAEAGIPTFGPGGTNTVVHTDPRPRLLGADRADPEMTFSEDEVPPVNYSMNFSEDEVPPVYPEMTFSEDEVYPVNDEMTFEENEVPPVNPEMNFEEDEVLPVHGYSPMYGLSKSKPYDYSLIDQNLGTPPPPGIVNSELLTHPAMPQVALNRTQKAFEAANPADPQFQFGLDRRPYEAQVREQRLAEEAAAAARGEGPRDNFKPVNPDLNKSMNLQYKQMKEDQFRRDSKQRQANNITRLGTLFSSILPPGLVAKVATGVSGVWADIEDSYRRAADTAEEATLATQKPLQNRFAAEEKYLNQTADDIDQNMEDLFVRSTNRLAQMAEIDQQIQAGRRDPRQAWEDKGIAANVLGALGSGLYRFLQVGQGGVGGANPVVQVFERSLQRDLEAQAANLDKLFQQRSHLRQDALDDERLVELKNATLAKSAMYRISGAVATLQKELAGDHLSLKARQEKEMLIAALQERGAAFMLDAFGGIAKYHLASLKKRGGGGSGPGMPANEIVQGNEPGSFNTKRFGINFGVLSNGKTRYVINIGDKTVAEADLAALRANRAQRQALANIAAIGFGTGFLGNRDRELIKQQANIILAGYAKSGGRAVSDKDVDLLKDAILGTDDPNKILTFISSSVFQDMLDASDDNAKDQILDILGPRLKPEDYNTLQIEPIEENISHLLGPDPERGSRMTYEEIENQSELADTPSKRLNMAKEFLAFVTKYNNEGEPQFTPGNAPLRGMYQEYFNDMVIGNVDSRYIKQMRKTLKKLDAELARGAKILRGEAAANTQGRTYKNDQTLRR